MSAQALQVLGDYWRPLCVTSVHELRLIDVHPRNLHLDSCFLETNHIEWLGHLWLD